jgi:hypothetical protein
VVDSNPASNKHTIEVRIRAGIFENSMGPFVREQLARAFEPAGAPIATLVPPGLSTREASESRGITQIAASERQTRALAAQGRADFRTTRVCRSRPTMLRATR